MLYGNESISHYTPHNIAVWMSMAFQGGLLNIGGLMSCHRFVSHVTGFATFFGYEINHADPVTALGMLVVPLFFLLGAVLSGFMVDHRLRMHKKPKYYLTFGIIFFLILFIFIAGTLGVFGTFGAPFQGMSDFVLLALLCLICGIQNATVTTVSHSVVRTTHLTGITTDLGIGIVRVLHHDKKEGAANGIRIGLIVSFVLGSIVGGFVFGHLGYMGFIIPVGTSGALFALMIYFQVLKKNISPGERS